jgi:ribosomal protein S6--L-glutamate ligase
MGKYLILGGRNYANRRLLHEFQQLGHKAQIMNPAKLLPHITDTRDDKIYVSNAKYEEPERIYKKTVSAIVPRIGTDLGFYAKAVEHMNLNMGIPSTATAAGLLTAQDKVRTIQVLSRAKIKVPKTFAAKKVENLSWLIEKLGNFPIVAKLIFGSRGVGVFILTEALSASTGLEAFASQGHALLLQQFIETAKKDEKKHDFRAVVLNGEVIASIKRNSVGGDFRTNASIKEDCEGVELDDEMKEIAVKASEACGLAFSGVDLAKDIDTGIVYVYEVNGNPNYKATERYSKINVAKKLAEYAVGLARKTQKEEVQALEKSPLGSFATKFNRSEFNRALDPYDYEFPQNAPKGIPFLEFPDEDEDDNEDEFEAAVYSTARLPAKATLWDKVKAAENQLKRAEMPYYLNNPINAHLRKKWEKENL